MNKIIHLREQARVWHGAALEEVGEAEKDSEGNLRENTGIAGMGAELELRRSGSSLGPSQYSRNALGLWGQIIVTQDCP